MNAQNSEPKYLLIFRNVEWHNGLSPEEMQQVASDWMAWFNGLTAGGKALAGNPLGREGNVVSESNGRIVVDGPFTETKETIGGYFLLRVNSLEEAVAIAKQCPGLPYGIQVEVRPVADQCPLSKETQAQTELAETVA